MAMASLWKGAWAGAGAESWEGAKTSANRRPRKIESGQWRACYSKVVLSRRPLISGSFSFIGGYESKVPIAVRLVYFDFSQRVSASLSYFPAIRKLCVSFGGLRVFNLIQ